MSDTSNDSNNTEKESPQLAIMRQMLTLAEQQVAQSNARTRKSEYRSKLSEDRSRMSAERSEMSETRSYHNAERTLSVWIRTALSLMIFGIAIDRFGLLFEQIPGGRHAGLVHGNAWLESISAWMGAALVLLAVFMSLSAGLRFLSYALAWRKKHHLPAHHGPYLATSFAMMVTVFGLILLALMVFFAQ